jgi:hypothetical protein
MTIIGVDLGRVYDAAAIVVIEDKLVQRPTTAQPITRKIKPMDAPSMLTRIYGAIEVGRMVGVSYTEIAMRIATLVEHPRISRPYSLVLDTTGVGIAIWDMLCAPPYRLSPVGITSTAGKAVTESMSGYNVPKVDLMTNLEILLDQERFSWAAGMEDAETYREQMDHMKIELKKKKETFGADDDRIHDDYPSATAVALWFAEKILPPYIELPQGNDRKSNYNPARHGLTPR